jgi:hypothetical protein
MNKGYTAGGYPDSATGTVTSVIDTDIMPNLKAQEVALENVRGAFTLKEFSIKVEVDTWIVINDGAEIPVFAEIPYSNDNIHVYKLAFKTAVDYKIAYNY